MSWFDAAGLANIAKSALKEAQRTIDKALDIKEDEVTQAPTNTPVDTNSDDFFLSWGLPQSGNANDKKVEEKLKVITKSPTKTPKMATSLWGSFAGSFFDGSSENFKARDSVDSLDDSVDLGEEHFIGSKLVVQQSDEGESVFSRLSSSESQDENLIEKEVKTNLSKTFSTPLDLYTQTVVKIRNHASISDFNRLSVISIGSGKNSSESVEIISSSTGCTTSPETDPISFGPSISTSSSALGLKQISDSVEVVPESLTSPSSVEILSSDCNSSHRHSQHTDEFVSPLESPLIEDKLSLNLEKVSPESVEVIADQDEDDSVSYASISDTTSTILEPNLNTILKPPRVHTRIETVSESGTNDPGFSTDKGVTFYEPIAPNRTILHLALTQANIQLIDTQPQSCSHNISNMMENSNVIDIPQDNESLKSATSETQLDDDGSQSDRTVIASDNVMESSSDTSTTTESNTNSFYLKNMLADAMIEKSTDKHRLETIKKSEEIIENTLDTVPRETSPLSSESRSDLVKIGSDQASGHTSGDELETTTSSDIEIISSPNGDSSSTQSRHSPAKKATIKSKSHEPNVEALLGKMALKKIKGHNRELSETSSISDDSHSSEIERLIKRMSEMSEILELRESKLIEINRRNAELQELNDDFKHQLDVVLTKQIESIDLSQVTEEYTQRLSVLEKKFQQAIREKDSYRKQLEQSRQDAATRMSKGELESIISEKDETIKELREEGEKLSKQHLQHSNIIKKLRVKEKEHESTIKRLKENVEELTTETDRLKKSLTAKEEVERSQIEAIHQLTSKNKKIEYEISQLQGQVDDMTQKHDTIKKSFDAAKKELVDKTRASSELVARELMLQSLENEKKMTESQNEEIINQLEDLRFQLGQANQDYLKKEQALRNENSELLRRLEDAERRNEELAQSVIEVSKPLVWQLESLQATHNMKLATFEKIEQELMLKLNDAQSRLQSVTDFENLVREDCVQLRSKLTSAESQVHSLQHELQVTKIALDQEKTERLLSEQESKREKDVLQEELKSRSRIVDNLRKEIIATEQLLSVEKSANDAEKRKNVLLQDQIRNRSESLVNLGQISSPTTRNTSPTLSLGRLSLSESLASSAWLPDDQLDAGPVPRYSNMFEMQMLQTNLKQRDGEVQQLQWELSRREHERSLLNSEISNLLNKIEAVENKMVEHDNLVTQFAEIQQKYDTLCQLYGEKVEETDELKLDLQDVKEMYKAQIDELLRQQRTESSG